MLDGGLEGRVAKVEQAVVVSQNERLVFAEQLRELREDVMEIKQAVKDKDSTILQEQRSTNGRLRSLENWRWFLAGGLAMTAFVVGPGIGAVILILVSGKG